MSQKTSKRRHCPAVGREITSAECGANRGSRYACPPDCLYSLLAPANYDQLLDLEAVVDNKCMVRLHQERQDDGVFMAALSKALHASSPYVTQAFFQWNLFFNRDEAGRTFAERWEASGFEGLKNDETVLMRAKMQTRIGVIEVHRVLDRERIEVVDLLAPEPSPLIIQDRTLATTAVRFTVLLGWFHPLPHYWCLSGTLVEIPDWDKFEPVEIVTEIVRHLGGPTTTREMRLWLTENLVRFNEALQATALAVQKRRFAGLDVEFGKATYRLEGSFEACRQSLDALPKVHPDNYSDRERQEGFVEARVLFDESAPASTAAEQGEEVLGRVLLGRSQWRLEAMGAGRLERLRNRFESQLGDRVRFVSEQRDDLSSTIRGQQAKFDESLVPAKLVDQESRIIFTSRRVPVSPMQESPKDAEAEFLRAQDRAFLEDHIPALDGRTPREAARDPGLRPKLIRLLKGRIRGTDERNLRTGRSDDANWMLRELGLDEITYEPPPWRPPPKGEKEREEPGTSFPSGASEVNPVDLPPLPDEPLSAKEASDRLTAALEPFDSLEEILAAMPEDSMALIDAIANVFSEILAPSSRAFLIPVLVRIWLAMVPRGYPGPRIELRRLVETFRNEDNKLAEIADKGPETILADYLGDGPQPEMVKVLAASVLMSATKAPKALRPVKDDQLTLIAILKAFVKEIDEAVRG